MLKTKVAWTKESSNVELCRSEEQINSRWLLEENIVYLLESTEEYGWFMFLDSASTSYLYPIRIKSIPSVILSQESCQTEGNSMENTCG